MPEFHEREYQEGLDLYWGSPEDVIFKIRIARRVEVG